MHKFMMAAVAIVAIPAAAQAEGLQEIGYSEGTLGFEALVAGDYERALAQLERSEAAFGEDPAHMINLGQAYAQLGRPDRAAALYNAAIDSERHFDIVLSNGEVVDTRVAARRALRDLRRDFAAR